MKWSKNLAQKEKFFMKYAKELYNSDFEELIEKYMPGKHSLGRVAFFKQKDGEEYAEVFFGDITPHERLASPRSLMFSDHGLANRSYLDSDMPENPIYYLSKSDEFELFRRCGQSASTMTKQYMSFMTKVYGKDYALDELLHRTQNLIESAKYASKHKYDTDFSGKLTRITKFKYDLQMFSHAARLAKSTLKQTGNTMQKNPYLATFETLHGLDHFEHCVDFI